MNPFTLFFTALVVFAIVRSVIRFYREEEVFARYDARVKLAAELNAAAEAAAREAADEPE